MMDGMYKDDEPIPERLCVDEIFADLESDENMMLESVKSVREDDFILKLFYHCSFCLMPNDPENEGNHSFIVKLEENNGIIKTMTVHKCGGCGKINKFLIK